MVATIQHTDPVIVLLTIDGETLETTADHPFYTADGEWVDAADLEPGDDIRTLDGDTGEVEAVLFLERTQPMYNLTIAEAHTFFVGEGQWLVHNTGDTCVTGWDTSDFEYDINDPNIDPPAKGTRRTGVNRAWKQEQELVDKTGRGTRDWTQDEIDELLHAGSVTDYSGHHINNVASAPDWQGDPRNITFIPGGRTHRQIGHGGSWRNPSSGKIIDRIEMIEAFPKGKLRVRR